MKIISGKEFKRLKANEKINEHLASGYRANQLSLSFELAIINILEQMGLKEIEIPYNYFYSNKHLEVCENPATNNFIVKVKENSNVQNQG
jgi:hypothetical protein